MSAVELLSNLEGLGVLLYAKDGRLGMNAPKGVITPAIKEALTANKTELCKLIQRRAENEKAKMLFLTQGYVVMESPIVDDMLVVTRDRGVIIPDRWSELVIYDLLELEQLRGKSPDVIRKLHEAKKIFGGRIV